MGTACDRGSREGGREGEGGSLSVIGLVWRWFNARGAIVLSWSPSPISSLRGGADLHYDLLYD